MPQDVDIKKAFNKGVTMGSLSGSTYYLQGSTGHRMIDMTYHVFVDRDG